MCTRHRFHVARPQPGTTGAEGEQAPCKLNAHVCTRRAWRPSHFSRYHIPRFRDLTPAQRSSPQTLPPTGGLLEPKRSGTTIPDSVWLLQGGGEVFLQGPPVNVCTASTPRTARILLPQDAGPAREPLTPVPPASAELLAP